MVTYEDIMSFGFSFHGILKLHLDIVINVLFQTCTFGDLVTEPTMGNVSSPLEGS